MDWEPHSTGARFHSKWWDLQIPDTLYLPTSPNQWTTSEGQLEGFDLALKWSDGAFLCNLSLWLLDRAPCPETSAEMSFVQPHCLRLAAPSSVPTIWPKFSLSPPPAPFLGLLGRLCCLIFIALFPHSIIQHDIGLWIYLLGLRSIIYNPPFLSDTGSLQQSEWEALLAIKQSWKISTQKGRARSLQES